MAPSRAACWRPGAAVAALRPQRITPAAAAPAGSTARVVQAWAQGAEERGSSSGPASGTAAPSTPVAPVSDLQTRQVRLLPWQSSASTGAARSSPAVASDGYISGGEATAVARRASGAAASTSGRTSPSPSPQRSSLGPRPGNPPACEVCGGRGFVATSRDTQPCPACQQWRQRPDYTPGRPLLTLQDVDLSALEDALPGDGSEEAAWAALSASSGDEGGSLGGRRGRSRRPTGPMSAERRAAISRAMQGKGPKSEEHKRNIARAMRDSHARKPRPSLAGHKKRCGYCGQEGHNRRACPQLAEAEAAAAMEATAAAGLAAAAAADGAALQAAAEAAQAPAAAAAAAEPAAQQLPAAPRPSRVIVIEEVDDSLGAQAEAEPEPAAAAQAASMAGTKQDAAETAAAAAAALPDMLASVEQASSALEAAPGGIAGSPARSGSPEAPPASSAAGQPSSKAAQPAGKAGQPSSSSTAGLASLLVGSGASSLVPTVAMGPSLTLCPDGSWVFPLPRTKEECVTQAAQASLRAWDDGVRQQALELLLPQAVPTEDGGWPGGIRQQFRVAKPMVEALLLRLKQHAGLQGRITAELLDEADCVAAWQSERLAAVLFPTADTLPVLRRIDDALSGERLTMVVNPQWQTQGQIISDFGIGRARRQAERFVAAYEEVYYLRRVRVFGDDVRIMRCYPGQWQVHYVPPGAREEAVLLGCEDGKPTFERLMQLLKSVQGSRASKSWLDRFLTSSMGTFNEFDAFTPEQKQAAEAAAAAAGESAAEALQLGGVLDDAPALGDAQAEQQKQAEQVAAEAAAAAAAAALPRDIVTGEVLAGPHGSPLLAPTSRDIRLEPVNQIARWLGSQPGKAGPPAGRAQAGMDGEPPRRRPDAGSG